MFLCKLHYTNVGLNPTFTKRSRKLEAYGTEKIIGQTHGSSPTKEKRPAVKRVLYIEKAVINSYLL